MNLYTQLTEQEDGLLYKVPLLTNLQSLRKRSDIKSFMSFCKFKRPGSINRMHHLFKRAVCAVSEER